MHASGLHRQWEYRERQRSKNLPLLRVLENRDRQEYALDTQPQGLRCATPDPEEPECWTEREGWPQREGAWPRALAEELQPAGRGNTAGSPLKQGDFMARAVSATHSNPSHP